MSALSSGTDDITDLSGKTIGSAASLTVTVSTYTNQSVTYVEDSSTVSNVYFQFSSQTYTYIKNYYVQVTPDLTWSPTGTPSITYSLSAYAGSSIPTWVSISSTTGQLTITTPNLSSNTDFSFYINSAISGNSGTYSKSITISVFASWTDTNCSTCSSTSASVCTSCNTGYTLNSGSWTIQQTATASSSTSSVTYAINTDPNLKSTANSEKTVASSLVLATASSSIASSILAATSTINMWWMIGQIQLFFLLLLTRAFIPDSIKTVISGPDFALNPFESISFLQTKNYGSWTDKFNIKLNDSSLESLTIKSLSTMYNTVSFFVSLLYVVILHLLIFSLKISIAKWRSRGKLARVFYSLINRIFEFLTFSFYIRLMIEFNVFITVSALNEVYEFETSQTIQLVSLTFACLIVLFSVVFTLITLFLSLSSYKINEKEYNKLGEFFNGLKKENKFRAFAAIMMARRFIFVVLIITSVSISSKILIGVLAGIQVFYFITIAIVRPYDETQANMIDIINEFVFLILLTSLIFYNTVDDWTITVAYIYMQILVMNSVIDFLIVQGKVLRLTFNSFSN